ncbi:MAG: TetR/AcrR family transcriptional regulator [Candidatus Saccharibacteria bacterium]
MREIAKELGVSTGTLYHYFPTKKALLEQLFYKAAHQDAYNVLSKFKEDTPLEVRIKAFFDYVKSNETWFQDIVMLTIDFYRFQDSEEFFEVMREADRWYGMAFIKGLQVDPELALAAEVFLNGLVYHRLVFPESLSFDTFSEIFQDMFLCYVRSKQSMNKAV